MTVGNDTGEATLEKLIQRRMRAAAIAPAVGKADRGQPLALSAGQQQMWLLHLLDPANPAYLMTWSLRLSGRLDREAMRGAWEKLVERHEILRTRYSGAAERPVQVIDPPGQFELRVIDLAGEPESRRERRAGQIAEWERTRPFDLTIHHPIRVTLIGIGPELHLLVVNIHHIAFDGSSYLRIAVELEALYAQYACGRPAGLPDVTVQYVDYAAWELAGRSNGALHPHLDYWRRALADAQELPLPLDRPRPSRTVSPAGTVDVTIKPATAEGVRALAAAHRASPYMLMLAAYHAMLAHISQSADVSVGLPVSSRSMPALDDLVGYMLNTVVVRSHHAGGHTFAELLVQVRERFLAAMDHRAAPFKWVVDEVNPARKGTANPLFQAAFDMEPADDGAFRFAGLQSELLRPSSPPAAKFDLTLHVAESPDTRLFAALEYATTVIDEGTANAWAGLLEALLDAVVDAPDEPLSQICQRLDVFTPAARRVASAADVVAVEIHEPAIVDSLVPRIRQAWCEVLNVDSVATDDNFFDVNGDSLRAIALAGRLKADGIDLSAADIFEHQTIDELAKLGAARLDAPSMVVPVKPFSLVSEQDRAAMPPGVVDAYPLVAMQLGMLMELLGRPEVNTYQDTTSYRIRDDRPFDADALQRAVQLVVNRHEVLRTTFDLNSYSVPLQLVHREAAITVGVTEYGPLGPDGWLPRLKDYAASERRSPMDLGRAPLIRVAAHAAEDSAEWWLTITECHPILEGWSFHTMLMEFLTAYQDIRAGRTPVEPDPQRLRYADYVAAEAAARQSEDDRAYWRGVIEGRVDATLPTDWQDSRDTPRDRYQYLVDIQDLDADLRRLATHTRTSLKAVLLAAHLKVMSMVFGSRDFFTGVVCDARPEVSGSERVLGMYLNTLPFAMPGHARTWGDLVAAVYDGLTGMWPHRAFPMQVIQQEFNGGDRLLDVFFNYLDFHQVDGDLVDESQIFNDNDNEFALHVFTFPGILKFNTTNHRLGRDAAVRLAALYRTVLEEMSYGPHGDAGAACLPPAELARNRWPGSEAELAREPATVLQSFAQVVRDHPGAPAVRCDMNSLTYEQLDNLAAVVAQRLRASGVGPGSLVAVTPERNVATPAALMAVWMSGAAWILIEPGILAEHRRETGQYADVSAVVAATEAGLAGTDFADLPIIFVGDETGDEQTAWPRRAAGREAYPRPADVALVIPAGETGLVLSHRALAAALASAQEGLETHDADSKPGSSWLCASPLTSACGVSELLAPLTSAGTAVITKAELLDATIETKQLVDTRAVTHLRLTPLVAERVRLDRLADGITVIMLRDHGVAQQCSVDGGRVIQSVEVEGLPGWIRFGDVSLAGLDARVVDDGLRPVPTGVVGELCLTGPRLPDGFHADQAGTADRFVPDPAGPSGSRLYRTKQLARFTTGGTLELLGPIEQRTRLGGHRAEPYRARELVSTHLSAVDSCAVVRPWQGKDSLVGYVRVAAGAALEADGVRRYLAEARVPRRFVPDVVVPVERWPLDACGRIDLDRLPEPRSDAGRAPAAGDRPWDDQFDALLTETLATVSYLGELTPDVPLFDLGLDSFSTVGLLVALERAYDITIPDDFQFVDMFRTVRALWETVAALRLEVR